MIQLQKNSCGKIIAENNKKKKEEGTRT